MSFRSQSRVVAQTTAQRRSRGSIRLLFILDNAPLSERLFNFNQGVSTRRLSAKAAGHDHSTAVSLSQSNALLRRTSPKDVGDLDADLSEQVLEASYRITLTECRGSESGSTECKIDLDLLHVASSP